MNWTLSAFCYFYFVFVGICYLLGFWIPLHFNVLEFLSPIDMIKSATYPVIPAALGIFVWVLVDSFNSQGAKKPKHDAPMILKVLFWILIVLFILMFIFNMYLLASYLYSLLISEPEKRLTYALPAASMISIFYFLSKPPFLINSHKFIRHFLIIFICALPTTAYFQGYKNIKNILEGNSIFHYLKNDSKSCLTENGSKMIYLGYYGSSYFFVNSKSEDICIEKDGGVLLSLNDNKKENLSSDSNEVEVNSNNTIQPAAESGG